MKDKILEAVQISKTYGEGESAVQALKASDLTIWKGEFASIIGSSGSGKSTLLKILGGLLPPTTGNVLLDGQDLYAMNAEQLAQVRRQKIGFIFQDFRLFPEYTVRDNILIPFYLDHRTPDEQMLRKLTEILGIAEKLDARPSQISGGQQQRVAIARALAAAPAIILADEPTGNLDSKTSQDVLSLLKVTSQKFAQTIVMITHNEEIAQMADRIIRIEDGRIVSQN
jgi:putative ABC transport system ATP-binding protein